MLVTRIDLRLDDIWNKQELVKMLDYEWLVSDKPIS